MGFVAMRILMLADVFFPDTIGGAGRVVYHLSNELSIRGHEIHVLTRNPDGKLPDHQKVNPNLFVHRFFSPQKESFLLFIREIENSYSLGIKMAREINFDLVCTHQSLVAIGPSLSRHFKQIPFLHYFHSPWHEEFLVKKQGDRGKPGKKNNAVAFLMRRMEKRILYKAAKVIALSQYMFDKALETHHCPKSKMVKIPGGVDLKHFRLPAEGRAAIKDALKLPRDKTVFLTVRNLVPRMGLETLIETFDQSKILKQKASLLIGGEGFLEERLKSTVESSDLRDSIRFLGHVPEKDLPKMYQASDFFVLPTRELEGFGLVILEAMASGTPVLGTPVGAIPEVIGSFDRELVFDGTGWQDMRNKLEEVIERPDRFRFSPQACRAFVEENFSWNQAANAFEQEAKRLVEGKK